MWEYGRCSKATLRSPRQLFSHLPAVRLTRGFKSLDGLPAIGCCGNLVAKLAQQLLHCPQGDAVILDKEDMVLAVIGALWVGVGGVRSWV